MSNFTPDELDDLGLDQFEEKLIKLLRLCEQLKAENIALRARQASLMEERAELLSKNEMARTRVESMLNRLKDLEPEV